MGSAKIGAQEMRINQPDVTAALNLVDKKRIPKFALLICKFRYILSRARDKRKHCFYVIKEEQYFYHK